MLLRTLPSSLHLNLHIPWHYMGFVLLVLDMRLNTLTFKFFITSGTYIYACGSLILLQLPLNLLVFMLKEKNTGSLLLTLTIRGLTLRSWLIMEIQLNEFMLVKIDKIVNPEKNAFLAKSKILLHYVIFFIK